jgi:ankyrin repeat protein
MVFNSKAYLFNVLFTAYIAGPDGANTITGGTSILNDKEVLQSSGSTALHLAAGAGHLAVVQTLVRYHVFLFDY